MLDQNTIDNAQSCISQVADVEALVAAFYDKLFATHPEVRGMFADDMSAQIVSLSNILKLAFSKLDSVGDLVAPLKSLGAKHAEYGVVADHYGVVATTLIATIKDELGDGFSADMEDALGKILTPVAETMLSGVDA